MSQPALPDDQLDGQLDDQRAFEALADQVVEPVRRYLARRTDPATAADALSEVLLVLWRRLDEVPPLAPLPYAYTVARNCLYNAQRSAVRQQRLAERIAVLDPPAGAVPAHHDRHDGEDLAGSWGVGDDDVRRAVTELPAASAEVVRLWAWEQLTPAQIGEVVGTSANAVSIRLHRAKKQLAEALAPPTGAAGAPPHQRPDQRPDQDRRTP